MTVVTKLIFRLFYHTQVNFSMMGISKIQYSVGQVLNYVPEELLSQFAIEAKADYRIRVLQGGIIFNLLLYMLLTETRFSQRSVGKSLTDASFHALFPNTEDRKAVNHSSVSRRINTMPVKFFQMAYDHLYKEVAHLYTPVELIKYHVVAVDSSLVAQTCNHLEKGFYIGPDKTDNQAARRKYVKYTAGFDGLRVMGIDFHNDKEHQNENDAIPEVVKSMAKSDRVHKNFYIIDRGLSAEAEYRELASDSINFLVRVSDKRRTQVIETLGNEGAERVGIDKTVIRILENDTVQLFTSGKNNPEETVYRHVKAEVRKPVFDTTGNVTGYETHIVNLISDVMDLEAFAMLEMYRQRWMIEVFFKFIKQNLDFSHLLSTKKNGLEVSMYMTMIAAMLILIYARRNKCGFRSGKEWMKHELSNLVMAVAIMQNGGKPEDFMVKYQVTLPDYLRKHLENMKLSIGSNHDNSSL